MERLLEKILGEKSECFTDVYVNEEFQKEYSLIKKITMLLSNEEFELLYKMINENEDGLYKLICYFNKKEE